MWETRTAFKFQVSNRTDNQFSYSFKKKKKVLLFKAEQLRIIISWKETGCRHGRPLKFQRGDLEVPDNNIWAPSRALPHRTARLYDGISHQMHRHRICFYSSAVSSRSPITCQTNTHRSQDLLICAHPHIGIKIAASVTCCFMPIFIPFKWKRKNWWWTARE